jgi:hypothetical protein
MKRLTIIGTTPNGDGVVLSDGKGAKFVVANDPRIAAVTEHDLSRQLEMALQTFSPREVQARVRGGDSADVIASETGWPLDKVLRYAEPLLAERAFIAEQAQAVEVRRSGGGSTLLEAAQAAIGSASQDAIAWDALRREDGKWIVTATYREADGAHTALWSYDHAGRNLHPLDDDARTLMGARPVSVPDAELDIAEALDLVADIPVVRAEAVETRPYLVAVPDADEEPSFDAVPAQEAAVEQIHPSAPTVAIPHPSTPAADVSEPESAPAPAAKKPAARKPKAPRKGRASVPSWDEILFGATRSDDQP